MDAGETKAVAVPVGTLTHEYHPVGGKKVKKTPLVYHVPQETIGFSESMLVYSGISNNICFLEPFTRIILIWIIQTFLLRSVSPLTGGTWRDNA